jgi:radical SAM/Cys-rich protein
MNTFIDIVKRNGIKLTRSCLTTLQVNMGDLCNQSCRHCHVGASPDGKKIMPREVMDGCVEFLAKNKGLILDITGGAPELNPQFDYLIKKASPFAKEIMVRSNLTVLSEPGKEYLAAFFKKNKIHLICSLPGYTEVDVDTQRGSGVFAKSIRSLVLLNSVGYAKKKELPMDIVFNPSGAFLPADQDELERDFRKILAEFGVSFNRLFTMTNVPVKRFKDCLKFNKEYTKYLDMLRDSFNPRAAENVMCRSLISVGFDGKVYNCDFNQALGWALKDKQGNFLNIADLDVSALIESEIMLGEHCFSCTAGRGSG